MKVGDIVVPITDDSVKMAVIGFGVDIFNLTALGHTTGIYSDDNSLPFVAARYMADQCNSKVDYLEKVSLKVIEKS